jgi:hypothetical protein
VSVAEVVNVLNDNNERVRQMIEALIPRLGNRRTCDCAQALDNAVIS